MTVTDRLETTVVLHASRSRVWRALTDAQEFGAWFVVKFDGPFAVGALLRGTIIPTSVDADVAKAQQPYEGPPFQITVDGSTPRSSSPSGGIPSPSSAVSITRASRPRTSF